jgi:flagellar basal-body rod modification protein FlgD
MTAIPPISTGSTSGSGAASGATSNTGLNQLGNAQTFLQLLVTQLQHQDPTNPTDPTAFMTEIAQLTAVQSQTTLSTEEQAVAADSMIGRSVTGQGASGGNVSGIVSAVLLQASGAPELEIGTGSSAIDVPITSVTKVSDPAASGSSSGTAGGTGQA